MVLKKIWLIGASFGIGKALALQLARQGHSLAVSARSQRELEQLKQELGDKQQHLALALDASNYEELAKSLAIIQTKWQGLDAMIFTAAVYDPGKISQMSIDNIDQTIMINLNAALYCVKTVLPLFLTQGKGQIALCASVAGYKGLAQAQPYAATKAGLINFAESLELEYGHILDIKLINPGFVKTRLSDKNSFAMPMQISTETAACHIANALAKKGFEIHFPKTFTFILKLLSILPSFLYFKIARHLQ